VKPTLCAFLILTLGLVTDAVAEFPEQIIRAQSFGDPLGNESQGLEPLTPSPNGTYAPSDGTFPPADGLAPLTQPNTLGVPPFESDPFNPNPGVMQPIDPMAPVGPGYYPQEQVMLGAQPFDFGWKQRYDFAWLPEESVNPGTGKLETFEFDAEWSYTTPFADYWILTSTPQFGLRDYQGPLTTPDPTRALPDRNYRFGWDLQLETPANGPWSWEFGFTPAIGTDLQDNLTSDAYFWDGRGRAFYRVSPMFSWVLGVGFWDRVNDQWIPYAGFLWNPDPRWEFRIMSPESRISYFMGHFLGYKTWLYGRAEYNVEAYEVNLETAGVRDVMEVEDWRAVIGIYFDRAPGSHHYFGGIGYQKYIEAGWVFNREVNFGKGTPGFEVADGYMIRGGYRF